MTFEPDPHGAASLADPVRCRYRGGASTANPRTSADIAAGLLYQFVDCQRPCPSSGHWRGHGRDRDCDDDDDDGDDWCSDPALVAGTELDVASATVHVQQGSDRFPAAATLCRGRRGEARTTVTVSLAVTPFILQAPQNDFYQLGVYDPAGTLVHSAIGDFASGDVQITLLP